MDAVGLPGITAIAFISGVSAVGFYALDAGRAGGFRLRFQETTAFLSSKGHATRPRPNSPQLGLQPPASSCDPVFKFTAAEESVHIFAALGVSRVAGSIRHRGADRLGPAAGAGDRPLGAIAALGDGRCDSQPPDGARHRGQAMAACCSGWPRSSSSAVRSCSLSAGRNCRSGYYWSWRDGGPG